MLAIDDLTAAILREEIDDVESRAEFAKVDLIDLIDDPYVFTGSADGSVPWKPDAVSQYFTRMRKRIGLDHLDSIAQVAMRAGHDPSIAAKHYSGRVTETDQGLATALASLIAPGPDAGEA